MSESATTKEKERVPSPPKATKNPPGGHLAYQRLHANLTALKLNVAESIVDNYLESAAAEEKSTVEVLDYLLDQEVRARSSAAVEMRLKLSGFPVRKTLEEFDLNAQPSIDPRVIQELRTLRFVHNAENAIFLGPPGVGKTHLSLALGYEAVKAGFLAYYISATQLVQQLKRASETDRLDARLRSLGRYAVLIVDEIGYLPMDRVGAHLFFQLVNRRYEKGSTIFTSNKPYSEWGEILGDSVIAAATLDRILHHSTTVNITGASYRLMSRRKAGLPTPTPALPVEA